MKDKDDINSNGIGHLEGSLIDAVYGGNCCHTHDCCQHCTHYCQCCAKTYCCKCKKTWGNNLGPYYTPYWQGTGTLNIQNCSQHDGSA